MTDEWDIGENCPLASKNHLAHDNKIRELEDFKKGVSRTPRLMADRIVKLEKLGLQQAESLDKARAKIREQAALLKKWM
jgi:hypothetical protein